MSKLTWARSSALKVCREVRSRNAFARPLIDRYIHTAVQPGSEQAFATRLVLGVVSTSGELDLIIQRALPNNPPEHNLLDALRISVYEMAFLKKPAYLAVSQGVELARSINPHSTGFANWALHRIAESLTGFPWGNPAADVSALAHLQAFPAWFAERLIDELGWDVASEFMSVSNQPAPTFLVDVANNKSLRVNAKELADYREAIVAGHYLVVDANAQRVAQIAAEQLLKRAEQVKQPTFLEIGSGRGSKTVLINLAAHRAGCSYHHHALDIHEFKNRLLSERIRLYGLQGVYPLTGDARKLSDLVSERRLPAQFDCAFIDAPCSGSGTLRRHPEIRWALNTLTISSLAARAQELLAEVALHIAKGGSLVYATCSVMREENETTVKRFLRSPIGQLFEQAESFRSTLSIGGGDVHYAAVLKRRG
ncbi:MAG: antitermination protein NusB [Actinomycetia bacterium]|nr:antitermination protein NusB [Actinomycetes bacterium]